MIRSQISRIKSDIIVSNNLVNAMKMQLNSMNLFFLHICFSYFIIIVNVFEIFLDVLKINEFFHFYLNKFQGFRKLPMDLSR